MCHDAGYLSGIEISGLVGSNSVDKTCKSCIQEHDPHTLTLGKLAKDEIECVSLGELGLWRERPELSPRRSWPHSLWAKTVFVSCCRKAGRQLQSTAEEFAPLLPKDWAFCIRLSGGRYILGVHCLSRALLQTVTHGVCVCNSLVQHEEAGFEADVGEVVTRDDLLKSYLKIEQPLAVDGCSTLVTFRGSPGSVTLLRRRLNHQEDPRRLEISSHLRATVPSSRSCILGGRGLSLVSVPSPRQLLQAYGLRRNGVGCVPSSQGREARAGPRRPGHRDATTPSSGKTRRWRWPP